MTNLQAVIMAGGSGTRFWPASRRTRPKQFLPLAGGRTLIEATVARLEGLVGPDDVWIVTNGEQAPELRRVMPDFPEDRLLIEPEARDTAPCIAFATAYVEATAPGAVMAVMPADHVIEPADAFRATLRRGAALARDGETLVTFGIRPDRPATGFGYIEPREPIDDQLPRASWVAAFREKPNRDLAERYLASGTMLWNSGIFVWTANAIRAAMERAAPRLAQQTAAMLDAAQAHDAAAVGKIFRTTDPISIDYAVMEGAPRIAVVEADLAWNDLGSFLALDAVSPRDADGNVRYLVDGASDVVVDGRNNVVYGEGPRTVALLGVSDMVVVQVEDVVMVCPRHRADDLKELHAELARRGRHDLL